MRGDDLGIQLLFIPEEYGGMGGGNIHHPEVGAWLRETAARGAVAIGGAPWNADDPAAATRAAADLVAGTGLGLDLHMDETDDPSVCTLPALAAAVEDTGPGGRAVAGHCCSLAGQPLEITRREAEQLAQTGVAIVVCPVSNLLAPGPPNGRRLSGASPGAAQGVGHPGDRLDNLCDVVVAVGTPDPRRAAWFLSIVGHLTTGEELEWLGPVVTAENRRICGMDPEPDAATGQDQLVIEAGSPAEAVALVPARWRKGGRR